MPQHSRTTAPPAPLWAELTAMAILAALAWVLAVF